MRVLWVIPVLAANFGCQSTEVPPVGEGESTSALAWGAPDVVLASNPTVSANFGNVLAVHGDFAIAGAPHGETDGTLGGAAYVLSHSPLGWGAVQQLTVPGLQPYDEYGFAVGMDADHACVGAPQRVTQGPGRALVYDRASNWTTFDEVQPLNLWSNNFGWACAVDGDTLVVSDASHYDDGISGGAVFVFDRVGASWTQSGLLHQGDLTGTETLGNSVAISGDTVVVGSWPFGTDIGGAFVYQRVAGVWQSTATLLPSVPVAGARFGYSVGVSGDVIVVGAFTNDGGAAYVYERTGGSWVEKQILATGADQFGFSVAIHGRRLAVGSASVAFVYEHVGDEWVPAPELPPPTTPDFSFGTTVALGSSTLLVGAPAGSLSGVLQSGTVYAFGMTLELGDGCDVDADCSEGFCVDGVCCNELCGGNSTDDCMACSIAAGGSTDGTCGVVGDGAGCDDGDECTQTDGCQAGACVGSDPVVCETEVECAKAGACDPATGSCETIWLPNGTPCSLGTCQSAVCTAPQVSDDAGADAAPNGDATKGDPATDDGGCGCRTSSSSRSVVLELVLLGVVMLLGRRRGWVAPKRERRRTIRAVARQAAASAIGIFGSH